MFFMISGSLYAISYTAISSSFHQFVTNPTPNQLKSNVSSEMVSRCIPNWLLAISIVYSPESNIVEIGTEISQWLRLELKFFRNDN